MTEPSTATAPHPPDALDDAIAPTRPAARVEPEGPPEQARRTPYPVERTFLRLLLQPDRHPWRADWEKARAFDRWWRVVALALSVVFLGWVFSGCGHSPDLKPDVVPAPPEVKPAPQDACRLDEQRVSISVPEATKDLCVQQAGGFQLLTAPISSCGAKLSVKVELPPATGLVRVRVWVQDSTTSLGDDDASVVETPRSGTSNEPVDVKFRHWITLPENTSVAYLRLPTQSDDASTWGLACPPRKGCQFRVEVDGAFGAPALLRKLITAFSAELDAIDQRWSAQDKRELTQSPWAKAREALSTQRCAAGQGTTRLVAVADALEGLLGALNVARNGLYGGSKPKAFKTSLLIETSKRAEEALASLGRDLATTPSLIERAKLGSRAAIMAHFKLMKDIESDVSNEEDRDRAAAWLAFAMSSDTAAMKRWRALVPPLQSLPEATQRQKWLQALGETKGVGLSLPNTHVASPTALPVAAWLSENPRLCYAADTSVPVPNEATVATQILGWLLDGATGARVEAANGKLLIHLDDEAAFHAAVGATKQVESLLCNAEFDVLRVVDSIFPTQAAGEEALAKGASTFRAMRAQAEKESPSGPLVRSLNAALAQVLDTRLPIYFWAPARTPKERAATPLALGVLAKRFAALGDLIRVPKDGPKEGSEALCASVSPHVLRNLGSLEQFRGWLVDGTTILKDLPFELACAEGNDSAEAFRSRLRERYGALLDGLTAATDQHGKRALSPLERAAKVRQVFGLDEKHLARPVRAASEKELEFPPPFHLDAPVNRYQQDPCEQDRPCQELEALWSDFGATGKSSAGEFTGRRCDDSQQKLPQFAMENKLAFSGVREARDFTIRCYASKWYDLPPLPVTNRSLKFLRFTSTSTFDVQRKGMAPAAAKEMSPGLWFVREPVEQGDNRFQIRPGQRDQAFKVMPTTVAQVGQGNF